MFWQSMLSLTSGRNILAIYAYAQNQIRALRTYWLTYHREM